MVTDGGGWTVFQRRQDGSEDFIRNWKEYKTGFGDLRNEFWLGNDILHYLLRQGTYEMRMDMADFENQTRYVKYSSFNVGNETSNYSVTLHGYSGNVDAYDCFGASINNMMFSTKDQDNDAWPRNCAEEFQSGWWHNACHCANPNGVYLAGNTSIYAVGIVYQPWRGYYYSLKSTQLMVRRISN
uniref:Ficolin-1 n=1 Tax=Magallana gigas TaxID=29159 RepID=K1Q9A0_MAGGI